MIFEAKKAFSGFMRQSPWQHNIYYQTQRVSRLEVEWQAIRVCAKSGFPSKFAELLRAVGLPSGIC